MCWMREGVKTDSASADPPSGLSCHVWLVAICCNIQFTCCWLRLYQPRQVDHHTDLNPIRIIKDFQLTGGRNDQLLVKATQYTRSHCSQLKFKMSSSVLTHSVHFAFSQTNLSSLCFQRCAVNTDSVNNAYLFISPYLSARLIIEATTRI